MSKRTPKISNIEHNTPVVLSWHSKYFESNKRQRISFHPQRWHVPTETITLVVRSSGLWEAYTQTCPKWDSFFTTTSLCRSMIACQVSWISDEFRIYYNLKTKFLNLSGRATTPRCLNFIPISCMGPRYSPKDTHVTFQPTLVHWSMCL